MGRGTHIAALRQLRHYSKSSKGHGTPTGKAPAQDPLATHPSLREQPPTKPNPSSGPVPGTSVEPPGADSLAKSRGAEQASTEPSGKQSPLHPPKAAKLPTKVPDVQPGGKLPGTTAGGPSSGAPIAPARGTGGTATPGQAPAEPQLLVHKPPPGPAAAGGPGGPAGVAAAAPAGSGINRVLPWIGLAALTYGGYYYYQEQQKQQGRAAGPNIFLGGQGPRPAKGQQPPGEPPSPAEAYLPDAQDTLKKQQESAARLKQEFEQPPEAGRPPSQPEGQPAEAQQTRQVPFHEEELALPRQQQEAASTSPSDDQRQSSEPSGSSEASGPAVDPSPVIALLDDIGRDHFSTQSQDSGSASPQTAQAATQKSASEAAAATRSERAALEEEAQQTKLEQQKASRLEKLKGSTPEAMQIMREAIGDSAGQFMVASHGQDKLHKEAKDEPSRQHDTHASEQGQAEVSEDTSAIALVRHAIETGEGDWGTFDARLKQAEADSKRLSELLQKAAASHREGLEAAQTQTQQQQRRAEGLQAQVDRFAGRQREEHNANAAKFRQHLAEQLQAADTQRDAELQRQAQFMTVAAAEAAVAERSRHSGDLDQLRTRVNALSEAFHRRSDERVTSATAHKLAAGTFALQEAIGSGRPFEDEVERLAAACEDDHLVIVALTSLSYDHACRGLPTREQLSARWPSVRGAAGKLGMLTQGQGGLLSLGLARLASSLKVHESAHWPASSEEGGSSKDSMLAQADQLLSEGQLSAAAAMLRTAVTGTAAEAATREWIKAAEARAVAEQALTVLQAHAATLSASLS